MAKMEIVETTAFPDSDDNLIRQALEGHQSAFTQLMERYREMLTIFVDSILCSNPEYLISAEDAIESKDICQVAMHKAFAHLHEYNNRYSFTTWLYNIAKNSTIDYLRSRRFDIELNPINESRMAFSGALLERSPEEDMIHNQAYSTIIERIKNLPPLYEEVARLRFVEEYALEEIAQKLNMSLNTVKTRLRRSKLLLENSITK